MLRGGAAVERAIRFSLLPTLVLLLGGCSALPGPGPQATEIGRLAAGTTSVAGPLTYLMVPIDPLTVSLSNHYQLPGFQTEFRDAFTGSRATTVGVGDRLSVNIWEPSTDGVFATSERKQTSLIATVDEEGKIYIPYAGRVQASGRHVEALRRAIEAALRGKAVEPQVQVVLDENASNKVVMLGDLARPGQYPVPLNGLRLTEAIAQAGGTKAPVYETVVTVARGGNRGAIRLEQVVSLPGNNIWLAPNDSVIVQHRPRTFSAFGAVQQTGLHPFHAARMSLAEALARAKGLRDDRADAGGIFLFRLEERAIAERYGKHRAGLPPTWGEGIPVVYRLNFNRPDAMFLAQTFRMKDKDVLYVANHPTAEFGKFLSSIVSPMLGSARTVAELGE